MVGRMSKYRIETVVSGEQIQLAVRYFEGGVYCGGAKAYALPSGGETIVIGEIIAYDDLLKRANRNGVRFVYAALARALLNLGFACVITEIPERSGKDLQRAGFRAYDRWELAEDDWVTTWIREKGSYRS